MITGHLELEFAIFAGVLLSLVLYLERTSKPRIVTLAPVEPGPTPEDTTDRIRDARGLGDVGLVLVTAMPMVSIIGLQYDRILRELPPTPSSVSRFTASRGPVVTRTLFSSSFRTS